MIIDKTLLDSLTEQAKVNPRLRQAYDLRNSLEDKSQRMLNALEPGTVLPIHRHINTSEVTAVIRGKVRLNFFDEQGRIVESFVASASEFPNFYVVSANHWHNIECLKSGTIIFECKDGTYAPLSTGDILEIPLEINGELKQQISDFIDMEHRSGSMEVITPLYVSRMLNISIEKVEPIMKKMDII